MTDTITPDEYRTAAKVMLSDGFTKECGGYAAEASWCEQQAARLEAESARDEEVEKLAQSLFSGTAGHFVTAPTWDAASEYTRDAFRAAARTALDRLAADGRLLPEGGTALDDDCPAEDDSYGPDFAIACIRVAGHSGDHLASSGDRIAYRWTDTPPAVSVPDSGPDGTPEKPWPSLNEVPGHVLAVLDVTGVRWARRSASGAWFGCDGQLRCCKGHPEVAPFVRVDGDKA